MRRALRIAWYLFLTVVVLAVITNLVSNYVELPLWLIVVIGAVAFGLLLLLEFTQRPGSGDDEQRPETPSGPYQPPRPPPEFTGREEELKRLAKALKPGAKTAITGLAGMGGLGKTELAKLAAHGARGRFPDGVLWADYGEQDLGTIADLWAAA